MINWLKKLFNKRNSSTYQKLPVGNSKLFSDTQIDSNLKEHFFPKRDRNGLCGFVDLHNDFQCESKFENAKNFAKWTEPSYLAPVKFNGKWGYIDKNFALAIDSQFDDAMIFSEGVATVKKNGLWAYIDKKGNLLTDFEFRIAIESRDNERIVCDKNCKTGHLDLLSLTIYSLDEEKSKILNFDSIGVMSDELRAQLDEIEYSFEDYMLHYPCKVTLKSGEVFENALITDVWRYQRYWHNPLVMNKDIYINNNDVVKIEESPNRLPAHLANENYQGPESGMGYRLFNVEFDNGTSINYVSGNIIDFIPYPEGLSKKNAIGIKPGIREGRSERAFEFKWCLWK
jgi:hypothetical protein